MIRLTKKERFQERNDMNKQLHLAISLLTALILTVSAPFTVLASETGNGSGSTESASVKEAFHYEHDPMENPSAAKDIVVKKVIVIIMLLMNIIDIVQKPIGGMHQKKQLDIIWILEII